MKDLKKAEYLSFILLIISAATSNVLLNMSSGDSILINVLLSAFPPLMAYWAGYGLAKAEEVFE
jgi:hypothetical protein